MSKWINVKDKLPTKDDYNDYLITDGKHCYVGYYRHDADAWDNVRLGWIQGRYADTGKPYDIAITHWMPLPELPKEEIITAEFCKDCFLKLHPEFREGDLKLCKEEDLCEGCGNIVPTTVVGIKEQSLWKIKKQKKK